MLIKSRACIRTGPFILQALLLAGLGCNSSSDTAAPAEREVAGKIASFSAEELEFLEDAIDQARAVATDASTDLEYVRRFLEHISERLEDEKLENTDSVPPGGALDSLDIEVAELDELWQEHPELVSNFASFLRSSDVIQTEIYHGRETELDEFPDCVAVADTSLEWECTGTVIGPKTVLTAGHCLSDVQEGGKCFVSVGNEIGLSDPIPGTIHRHPDFLNVPATNTIHNDIAIISLDTTVPGALSRDFASESQIQSARHFTVVGFGHTNRTGTVGMGQQRKTPDLIAAAKMCSKEDFNRHSCIEDKEMLIMSRPGVRTSGACKGDSGGPTYVKSGGEYMLCGVVSRLSNIANFCGDEVIVVRLSQDYRSWIAQHM